MRFETGGESTEKSKLERDREAVSKIIQEGDWELSDGMVIGDRSHALGVDLKKQGSEVVDNRDPSARYVPQEGSWNQNGNVLALVGEGGKIFIAPASEARVKQLWESDLEKDGQLGVPMSHGEVPVHPGIRERWDDASVRATRQDQIAREERAAGEREAA